MGQNMGRITIKKSTQSMEQSLLRERSLNSVQVFYDDSILLPDEQRPDDEPDIELNDTYDDDDLQDTADVRIDEFAAGGAQPIWMLCSGQILWAGDRTGHRVNEMNQFRRRLQSYLDVLRREFKAASDADLLEAMHGFFKETNKKSSEDSNGGSDDAQDDGSDNKKKRAKGKGGWLKNLSGYSIICGVNRTMSLREFLSGSGKNKGRSKDDPSIVPPDGIMKLWVQRELNMYNDRDPKDILSGKKQKDGTSRLDEIHSNIQDLCDELNKVTKRYIEADSHDGSDGQSDGDSGIGLASPLLYVWSKETRSLNNELTKWKDWVNNGIVTR